MSNEEKRISAFENKAHRRLLEINYRHMKTNQYVNETIIKLVGKFEPLLTTIKRRKCHTMGTYVAIIVWQTLSCKEKLKVQEAEVAQRKTGCQTSLCGQTSR